MQAVSKQKSGGLQESQTWTSKSIYVGSLRPPQFPSFSHSKNQFENMGAPKGRQNKRKKEEAEKERRRIEAENAKKVGIATEASSSPSRVTQSALPLHPAPRPQPGPGLLPRPAPEQSLQPQLAIPPQPTRVGQPSLRHKSPEQQREVLSSFYFMVILMRSSPCRK